VKLVDKLGKTSTILNCSNEVLLPGGIQLDPPITILCSCTATQPMSLHFIV